MNKKGIGPGSQKVKKVTKPPLSPFCAKEHFLDFPDFQPGPDLPCLQAGIRYSGLPRPDSVLLDARARTPESPLSPLSDGIAESGFQEPREADRHGSRQAVSRSRVIARPFVSMGTSLLGSPGKPTGAGYTTGEAQGSPQEQGTPVLLTSGLSGARDASVRPARHHSAPS